MPTSPETARGDVARSHPHHWINVTAEDIPHGWIDDMVKRLFEELNRQILRCENAAQKETKEDNTPDLREQDSLTLARLEGTLNRLNKLDTQRAALRNTKADRSRRAKRAAIRSQILDGHDAGRTDASEGEAQ
jgi:hypothetical protein